MKRPSDQKPSAQKKARASRVRAASSAKAALSAEDLLAAHRKMLLARQLDNKMLIMLRQMKSFFHIGTSGHEAVQLAFARAMKPAFDYYYPYYRGMAMCLGVGMTPKELMLCFLARADDPNSGGRQMPAHFGHRRLNIVSQSSPTGTQFLCATGTALGLKYDGEGAVALVSAGEGTASQGELHEALNMAARDALPVIFLIEDNGYAISVPIAEQTAGADVYEMLAGYPGLDRVKVDGTDFEKSYQVAGQAVARARAGKGPTLVVANTVRLLPHSSSDDQRKYRDLGDLEDDKKRDPILKIEAALKKRGIADAKRLEAIYAEVKAEVDQAADWAETQPMPARSTVGDHLFAPPEQQPKLDYERCAHSGKSIVLVDAVNHALDEEMARNEKMIIYGEDVAGEKGGVFTATRGLTAKYGRERVFNSQLAEATIVGTAVGLAAVGYKPVVEIQFGDYVYTAMMQLRNELSTMRYRSNGQWSCAAVVRIAVGGYIHGSLCHSQNIEAFFAHIPGLLIALPCTAADAKGLLKTACRLPDPVLFLEHKGLYRQGFAQSPEPDADYLLPFGKGRVARPGNDATVISWGMTVHKARAVANELAQAGHEVEILDLRTIIPFDMALIRQSVAKTHRALVLHEDTLTGGFGAEIAARIGDECFRDLDAPVRRLASKDLPVPYNWDLEEEVLVQERDIKRELEALLAY